MSALPSYRLAELAGYEIRTVDIYNVVWVYCKEGKGSYRYIPETDLTLLVECVRNIPHTTVIEYSYSGQPDGPVECTMRTRVEGGSKVLIRKGTTEEEALYAALQGYLESVP